MNWYRPIVSTPLPLLLLLYHYLPTSSSYIMTPSAHRSTATPCPEPDTISGDKYSGVPHIVHRCWACELEVGAAEGIRADHPKSASFSAPSSPMSTFSGLISRWAMFLACRYITADEICCMYVWHVLSLIIPSVFASDLYSSPLGAYSRIK